MSRKVGQIIARGDGRWLVRVFLGRDQTTQKRIYYNRTIHGCLRQAQAHLTKKLHERDLRRGIETVQVTLDEFLDHWLKTAAKPRIREKTYRDYEAMLRRYIRPHIGSKKLAILSALDIQNTYQRMIEDGLSSRTVRYVHSVLRCALNQAVRWQQILIAPTSEVLLPRGKSREMRVLSTARHNGRLSLCLRCQSCDHICVQSANKCQNKSGCTLKVRWWTRLGKPC